jgi:hypothetical protein
MGLVAVLTYGIRATTIPAQHGIVEADIPILSVPIKDPGFHRFRETSRSKLLKTTTAIVLTVDAFYFGDLTAFSEKFASTDNKFFVEHVDGRPQLPELIAALAKWSAQKSADENIRIGNYAVFLPSAQIPMPIVIQVIDGLKISNLYDRVILGGGMI